MTSKSTPIEYFKKAAKRLLRQVEAGEAEALARAKRVLKESEEISLMRAQHVVAVESGFPKWENLIQASADDLQAAISRLKGLPNHLRPKLRVPPPGETPLVSFLRGPFDLPKDPRIEAFANLMDTMTMREQERWLDEDARAMGLFRR